MDFLYDSMSILEALYDLGMTKQALTEEMGIMSHNYKKTGDPDVLTEGVNDIITLIVSGLKKFIQKMKDFVVKHFMILNSYHMEYGKLISKYGKVLSSAQFEPFELADGYEFTVLASPKPELSKVYKIIEDFNDNIAKFRSLSVEDIREINNNECSEVAYSRLRGEVLGINQRISPEEFRKTCFMFYRNNKEFPDTITVSKETVDAIIKGSTALTAEKRACTTDKDTIMAVLNRMEKFFSTKVSDLYDDVKKTYTISHLKRGGEVAEEEQALSEKEMSKLMMYLSSRYQQVIELTNIISIVFVERVAAIKDQTNQETQILREVLKHMSVGVAESDKLLESANSYPPAPNTNWAPVWEGIANMGGELV